MLSTSDIARGTRGAVRFLQRDPGAPYYFDNTLEACLASFRVMALAAPLYGLYLLLYYSSVDTTADAFEIMAVEALHFVVDWLLFPVLFYEIARRRRWLANYPRYIAALNWINLPAVILLLIGESVGALAPPAAAGLLQIALQLLFFYWFMVTTRMVLGIDWLSASILMVVNWVPSYVLSVLVNRFLGVGVG